MSASSFGYPLIDLIDRLSAQPVCIAVRRGLIIVLPLVLVGAFMIMLANIPYEPAQLAIDRAFGPTWRQVCKNLIDGTFSIASLALLCAIGGVSAAHANQKRQTPYVSPMMMATVTLSCFFVLIAPLKSSIGDTAFSLSNGLLLAMCVALATSSIFLRLSRCTWLHLPVEMAGNDPVARDVFTLIPASIITILFFGLIRAALVALDMTNLHELSERMLVHPFSQGGDSLGFGVLYSMASQVLWFFGAHGPNMLFAVENDILIPAALTNVNAIASGTAPPFIFTKMFFDAYTRMGGSGCTLALCLAIFLRGKDRGVKKLCLFALLPTLCNVNEPLLFGIPLVLNPVYFIPFILVPAVQTVIAYTATVVGFIPPTSADIAWTTPALMSGYIVSGSINGPILQAVNLLAGLLIYMPFVVISDAIREKRSKQVMRNLFTAANGGGVADNRKCLGQPGEVGRLANALAGDLTRALDEPGQIHLVYQPQYNNETGRVTGVEALLRWNHPAYGNIAPPITVALAEDTGNIDRLGRFILEEACRRRAAWSGFVDADMIMCINVSPMQLQNPRFSGYVWNALSDASLKPGQLELEITESSMIKPESSALEMLRGLHTDGIRVAIDDFGMGYASLRYLRAFPVSTVKIDRSLTEHIDNNINQQIVRSVLELNQSLGISTVVEGVENREQLNSFTSMGFSTFQGYFFSRPLCAKDCLAYISANRGQTAE